MITVSVLYPAQENSAFDMDYYLTKHIPMVRNKLGNHCKGIRVEQGLNGDIPDSKAPFVTICHLNFDSTDRFQEAFAPHIEEIMGDIPNYTQSQPIIQISEIKLSSECCK